jgi:hypothetical protein
MKTETLCADLACDHSIAERPRYYARQLITDETLRLEQRYFIDRMRRHNRLMHGWGVVCGAQVCLSPTGTTNGGFTPWKIVVKPGYILGPYGDEIIIDCERVIDLRTGGVTGVTGEPGLEAVDPWCSDVYVQRDPLKPLYVAVKYRECQTRPLRVQPIGCGCDDTQCENSRVRDGYEIGLLNCCPEPIQEHPIEVDLDMPNFPLKLRLEDAYPTMHCPACPPDPWVVLGKVMVAEDGSVAIDNCACRRMVISLGNLSLRCASEPITITKIENVDDHNYSYMSAGTTAKLRVTGTHFKPGVQVYMGPGVTFDFNVTYASTEHPDDTWFYVNATAHSSAEGGKRRLTAWNVDCTTGTSEPLFEIRGGTAYVAHASTPMPAKATPRTPRAKKSARAKKKSGS